MNTKYIEKKNIKNILNKGHRAATIQAILTNSFSVSGQSFKKHISRH